MSKRTCSEPDCGNSVLAKGLCSAHYQWDWKQRRREKPTECRQCGAPINQVKRRGGWATYCGQDCADEWNGRVSRRQRLGTVKDCPVCGEGLTPAKSMGQKYCSARCKNLASMQRRLERGELCSVEGCGRVLHSRGMCNKHAQRAKYAEAKVSRGPVMADCEECGVEFENASGNQRFCSRSCQRRAWYTKRKAAPSRVCDVEGCGRPYWARGLCVMHYRRAFYPDEHGSDWLPESRRLALYERDGWACYLCGAQVVRVGDYNADDYATVDHVVPRAKGGDDSDENLRTCCRLCNSRKTDQTLNEHAAGFVTVSAGHLV